MREKIEQAAKEYYHSRYHPYSELSDIVDAFEIGLKSEVAKEYWEKELGKESGEEKQEYLLCAAIHFDDGIERDHLPINIKTGVVMCGRRHHNIFAQFGVTAKVRNESGLKEKEQGFITNTDRFVDRKEAMDIAKKSGQVTDKQSFEELYSEDLY